MARPSTLSGWLGRSLTRKFILLLAGFLALQVLQLYISVYGVPHIGEEGAYINQTGRMRMQTVLIGHLLHKSMDTGVWNPIDRRALEEALVANDAYFRNPVEAMSLANEDPEYNRVLEEAERYWHGTMRPLLSGFDPGRHRDAHERFLRYEAAVPAQTERFDRLARLLEEDLRKDSKLLAVWQVLFLGASILLGVIGLVLARFIVSRPLRELIVAAREIAAGAYHRRLRVSSRDEIGVMAATFNDMIQAIEQNNRRLMVFNPITAAISSSLSVDEIVNQVLPHGLDLSDSQAACLVFYDGVHGRSAEFYHRGLPIPVLNYLQAQSDPLAMAVHERSEAALVSDQISAPRPLAPVEREAGFRSVACLPLVSQSQRLGVLYFYRITENPFLRQDLDLFTAFARLAASAIHNARLYLRVQEESRTDSLTGLYNRREFDRRLQDEHSRSIRYEKPYAVAMLDIDYFKRINDNYGHSSGDAILRQVGGILERQFRDVDTVARYGGEEFIVLLPEISGGTAKGVVERVRRVIAGTSFQLPDKREIGVTVSCGISCYPNCAGSPAAAVNTADQALYIAKQAGRNCSLLYRETLKARIEKDPNLIPQLLNESLDNVKPVVTAISAKAPFLRPHCDQVMKAALALARMLKLGADECEALRLAALLHDIGMLAIEDEVLAKTTSLAPEDWVAIKQHPAMGADWLAQVPALAKVAAIVRSHHERYDGKGYPDGLRAGELPLLARVLAVADAYGSMVSDWPGSTALPTKEVIARLKAGAGTQFDPGMVELMVKALAENAE